MAFWTSVGVAEVLNNTADTVLALSVELPAAESPGDFFDILFAEDRKIYLGVALLILALLLVFMGL